MDPIEEEVFQKRSQEIEEAVQAMKSKLPSQGRCPTCTLKVPCKHYSNIDSVSVHPSHRRVSEPKKVMKKRSPAASRTETSPLSRLKNLDRIEAYREQLLQKEINKIEELKQQEKKENELKAKQEIKRMRRLKKQNEKIRKYKEELREKYRVMQEDEKKQNDKLALQEEKHKKLKEDQRRMIAEYHSQKTKEIHKSLEEKVPSPKYDYSKIYLNS